MFADFGTAGPIALGLALIALWLIFLRKDQGLPADESQYQGPMSSILDKLTDRAQLEARFATAPVGGSFTIDDTAIREALGRRIVGQDIVIATAVEQIRNRYKRIRRKGPVGVFLVVGPPGTGKSAFGRELGRVLFGDQGFYEADMTGASDEAGANTLFGSPTGYSGSQQLSPMMAHLSSNPRTVIVLNEFEKAHKKAQDRFLTAWSDGMILEPTRGLRISTTEAIFVLTSNAAPEAMVDLALDAGQDRDALSDRCKQRLKSEFTGPVLSRIDYVFPFIPLKNVDLSALIATQLEQHIDSYGLTLTGIDGDVLYAYVVDLDRRRADAREIERMFAPLERSIIELVDNGIKQVAVVLHEGKPKVVAT